MTDGLGDRGAAKPSGGPLCVSASVLSDDVWVFAALFLRFGRLLRSPKSPPMLNLPMMLRSMCEASISAEESCFCPASVEGMLPSSCPKMLFARSVTTS